MLNERIDIENALNEWVAALDTVDELIFMHDVEGRILRANRAYASRAGVDLKQIVGKLYWEVFPVLPNPFPLCPSAMEKGGMLIKEVVLDTGEIFVSHGYPIVKSEGGYLSSVHVLNDVTRTKQLEAEKQATIEALSEANAKLAAVNAKLSDAQSQLIQSEKMASIGALAAGVAHEINNPIGFVRSNLCTLERYSGDFIKMLDAYECLESAQQQPSEQMANVQKLKAQIDLAFIRDDLISLIAESNQGISRVAKIVHDLKDFSLVDRENNWAVQDLHSGLDSTINVAAHEFTCKCEIKKLYGDLPLVECLLPQLNQVFLNLLVNAAHAIATNGVITLRSGVKGDHVWLDVSDNGQGIAPEDLSRIFDPFFTTKPVGAGSGLGLTVSYNVIKQHHGRIEVESEVGTGTTFRIWLPIRQPSDGSAGA